MRISFTGVFLASLTALSASSLSLSQVKNRDNATPEILTITALPDLPNDRFTATPKFGPDLLPPSATLMVILDFMASLAYTDYNGSIPTTTWDALGYPQVQIVTENNLPVRYLLHGMFNVVEYMIKNNRFNNAWWTLRWEKRPVGRLKVQLAPRRLSELGNQTTLNSNGVLNPSTKLDIGPQNDNQIHKNISLAEQVQFGVAPLASAARLKRNDVFLLAYAGLIHLAPYDGESAMRDFVIQDPEERLILDVFHCGPGTNNLHVIQAINFLPRRMLEWRFGFKEIEFDLLVDGTKVMDGSVTRGLLSMGNESTIWGVSES